MEPFVLKDDAKRLVSGAVAIPGCKDCDFTNGEKILSVDEIEGMVHWFNANSRKSDLLHTYNSNGTFVGDTVENWTLKTPMTVKNILGKEVTYPKGTWMATTKINDDKTWDMIMDGTLRGYSATYMSKEAAKEFMANKRTLIADLEDPVPVLVSIVDNPCVEDAIFCSVKMEKEEEVDKAGRRFSNATLKKIQGAFESLQTLINDALNERGEIEAESSKNVLEDVSMNEDELKTMIQEAVKEALKTEEPEPEPVEETEEVEEEKETEAEEIVEAEPEPEEPSEAEKQLQEAQKRIAELEKKLGEGESQKIEGQDTETPVVDEARKYRIREGRDIHGRKLRK